MELPEGLTHLGKCCFRSSALEHVKLPSALKGIEEMTFCCCRGLRHIELPRALERIGACSFAKSGLEEIVFPPSVITVSVSVFQNCGQLRRVELNEGLQVLGEKWCHGDQEFEGTVFAESGIESIRLPSTLKTLEALTFAHCERLRSVEFAEGLERIGFEAFQQSGIEHAVLPLSTRIVCAAAFLFCESLRSAELNEGLEVLGAAVRFGGKTHRGSAFAGSTLESVTIPRTLRVIEPRSFEKCKLLRKIEFPEGMEALGRDDRSSDSWSELFLNSGLEEATLPSTLREARSDVFRGCPSLRTLNVAKGCRVKPKKLASLFVKVKMQ